MGQWAADVDDEETGGEDDKCIYNGAISLEASIVIVIVIAIIVLSSLLSEFVIKFVTIPVI